VVSIWPTWSSRCERTNSFRKVGITLDGLNADQISKRSFNFDIPECFKAKLEPDFSKSPEGVRKGSAAYLQEKLNNALAHVDYLKKKPMLPSEKGIFVDQC
jgi:hypothetical protein